MTAQIHELLIDEGKPTSMAFCPPLPENHPRITVREPSEVPEEETGIVASTACWRGYQGTWQIRDGRFYLVSLRGRLRLEGTEPLPADWFSGMLRIPEGKRLHYVHMGFGSIYEREVHVVIESGVVTDRWTIDNGETEFDRENLTLENLPGRENRFPGDDVT